MSVRKAAKPSFPIEISVGSARVRIYEVRNASGSYLQLVYYDAKGTRRRVTRSDLGEAKAEARRIATAIHNGSLQATPLTEHDRMAFERAAEIAKRLGSPVDVLLAEVEEARKKLPPGVALSEAVGFYAQHSGANTVSKILPEVVAEFEAQLRIDGRSKRYLQDARSRLRRLAEAFPGKCDQIKLPELQKWLNELLVTTSGRKKAGGAEPVDDAGEASGAKQSVTARSRNNYRALVVSLFHFARDHGYLPADLPTAADRLKKAKDEGGDIGILAPEQMKRLLGEAQDRLIPYLAIGAFAGLRSAEILSLDWAEVNFAQRHIEVKSGKAKTGQRRHAPMPDNLAEWLKPHKGSTGPVCPTAEVRTDLRSLAGKLQIAWPHNGLRHSFASYRLAEIKEPQTVAFEMGNSPSIINRHYRKLVTAAQAKAWFGIRPAGR